MENKARKLVHVHRLALAMLTAILVVAMASFASAQQTPPAQPPAQGAQPERDNDITRGELQKFNTFLDNHPGIAKDLQGNPSLVNDPNYLAQHPELKDFLEDHPGVRRELKEHPKFFMHREQRFERHERGEHHRKPH